MGIFCCCSGLFYFCNKFLWSISIHFSQALYPLTFCPRHIQIPFFPGQSWHLPPQYSSPGHALCSSEIYSLCLGSETAPSCPPRCFMLPGIVQGPRSSLLRVCPGRGHCELLKSEVFGCFKTICSPRKKKSHVISSESPWTSAAHNGQLSPRVHQKFNFITVSSIDPILCAIKQNNVLTSKIICNNSPLKAFLNMELSN